MELEFKVKDNQFFNVKEIIKSQFQISDRLLVKLKREKRIFLNGTVNQKKEVEKCENK